MRILIISFPLIMILGCGNANKNKDSTQKKNETKRSATKINGKTLTLGKPYSGFLSLDDPFHHDIKRPYKFYKVELSPVGDEEYYQVDLESNVFRPFLRLEDDKKKKMANGYGGELIITPRKKTNYRIIISTFDTLKSNGSYKMTITKFKFDKTNEAPLPKEKWNLEYAVKTWGLAIKDFKYIERVYESSQYSSSSRHRQYKFLFEFSKDLKPEEIKSLKSDIRQMEFYCFDENNVVVYKLDSGRGVTGEITGVKGDAFWLYQSINLTRDFEKTKRIELRPK